jgi:hypothetical protein
MKKETEKNPPKSGRMEKSAGATPPRKGSLANEEGLPQGDNLNRDNRPDREEVYRVGKHSSK